MKIEIERYITKNYYELLKIARKYTDNDDWSYELLHEVILQLYDQKSFNNKIKLDDKSIKYYIIRILMVNWCYPTSPFYKKHKREMKMVELNEVLHITEEETEMEHHKFMEIIEQEFSEVNWWNKVIFEKYMLLGSLKKVAVDTTISLPSIARYVKETKTQVKLNTFKRYNNE
jgi:hypothetical protein